MYKNQGFTLIELMITIVILGVVSMIAIPSYRQYIVKNNESQVQARMSIVQIELEKWRASVLSFRGFVPTNVNAQGQAVFSYANSPTNTTINVPSVGTARYTITLVSGNGATLTTPITANNLANAQNATSWVMVAHPTDTAGVGARVMLMKSDGQRCMSRDVNFCATPSNQCVCNDTTESW